MIIAGSPISIGTAPTIILGVFGIVALLAATLAIARANFAKAQIEALRGDRDDQEKRIKRQDEEILGLHSELQTERSAREALERVVTGKDLLTELRKELLEHHTSAMKGLQIISSTMEELLSSNTDLTDQVKSREGQTRALGEKLAQNYQQLLAAVKKQGSTEND